MLRVLFRIHGRSHSYGETYSSKTMDVNFENDFGFCQLLKQPSIAGKNSVVFRFLKKKIEESLLTTEAGHLRLVGAIKNDSSG